MRRQRRRSRAGTVGSRFSLSLTPGAHQDRAKRTCVTEPIHRRCRRWSCGWGVSFFWRTPSRTSSFSRACWPWQGGALAINEVSDWGDPLLYAASTGADLTRHDLGSMTGWSGTTTANPHGPITFLVWSPQPGVLLEIDSTNSARSIAGLAELATKTTVIPANEGDVLYPLRGRA